MENCVPFILCKEKTGPPDALYEPTHVYHEHTYDNGKIIESLGYKKSFEEFWMSLLLLLLLCFFVSSLDLFTLKQSSLILSGKTTKNS